MLKFLCVVLFCLAKANSEYLYGDLPYNYQNAYASAYDNYKPRDYKFEYGVSDPHTGDHKSQWEVRENGVVRGAYSLLEPDGTTRIVEYYADDTGFHADVKKIGESVHAQPQHVYASTPILKTIADNIAYNGYGHGGLTHGYGAPIAAVQHVAQFAPVTKVVAPIQTIAPIAKVEHIAPIQQVIAPAIHQHVEYPQHISLEKYAHALAPLPKPIEYNNYYPKIEQYSPIAPAYYEQVSKVTPYYENAPIYTQEHKQIYNYEPQIVKAAPVYVQEPKIAHLGNYGHSTSYAQVNQYHDYPEQVVHVGPAHKAPVYYEPKVTKVISPLYNGGYSNYEDVKYFSQPAKAEIVPAPHNLAYAHQQSIPYPYAGYDHHY